MKLRITEGQYERLKTVINENVDNRYNREVTVNFHYNGAPYKGNEVEEITSVKTRVYFDIDIEARSWGISSMSLSGIIGNPEIETQVYYIPAGQDDTVDESIKINLDWSKLVVEETRGGGMVSIGDYLDVELIQNEAGGFVSSKMAI